jgi:hypothetical protein
MELARIAREPARMNARAIRNMWRERRDADDLLKRYCRARSNR